MRKTRIEQLLYAKLKPLELIIEDESHSHARGGEATHLKCLIVSDAFQGKSRVERQQEVLSLLKSEFDAGLHAFTMRCLTKSEHDKNSLSTFVSPKCSGHKE